MTTPAASFLQSWQWGKFQQSVGRKVARLSWQDKIAVQAIKMNLPLSKHYWYIPRGPLVVSDTPEYRQAMEDLFDFFKNNGSLFVRADPVLPSPFQGEGQGEGLRGVNIKLAPATQPRCARIINIAQLSEEELLQRMHPKTRYNIRLAEKKAVAVGTGNIDDFLRLNRKTAHRQKIKTHPENYYRKMAEILGQDSEFRLRIWQASIGNKILASALVIHYLQTAYYVHGASTDENKNLMAPYLLHWQIMLDAKAKGFRYYDLGGVNPAAPEDIDYKPSWGGITRFKAGFGGETHCYPQSFDLIQNRYWYSVYRILKGIYSFF